MATSIQTTPHTVVAQKAVKKQTGEKRVRNNVNTLKPVVVKTEKIAAAPAAKTAVAKTATAKAETKAAKSSKQVSTQPAASKKTAYIIVASLPTSNDAQRELKKFQQKGYKNCQVLESNGRFRIALDSYATSGEAYQKVQTLRKQEEFKSAWVFTSK